MSARVMLLLALSIAGCDEMANQPKQSDYAPLPGPAVMPDGIVQFGQQDTPPPPVSLALLQRGQERYHIFCAPCHAELGDGHGMIVQRGFPAPPSLHSAALRAQSVQHYYEVTTRGYGAMYGFADRVPSDDRWAIAAYVRALQRSQHASLEDVPASERAALP